MYSVLWHVSVSQMRKIQSFKNSIIHFFISSLESYKQEVHCMAPSIPLHTHIFYSLEGDVKDNFFSYMHLIKYTCTYKYTLTPPPPVSATYSYTMYYIQLTLGVGVKVYLLKDDAVTPVTIDKFNKQSKPKTNVLYREKKIEHKHPR